MGKPAARAGDFHMCPMVTPGVPPIPHVGGPILPPGVPTVLIGGMPAATLGSMCTCVGPPDVIILGSMGVMIGGKPAARMGDSCAHGGAIMLGCMTVLIGEMMPGGGGGASGGGALSTESYKGKEDSGSKSIEKPAQSVNPAMKMSAAMATKIARIDALIQGAETGETTVHKHNEEDCKVQYMVRGRDNKPAKDVQYEIHTSDEKVFSGKTGADGMTQQLSGYTEGMCNIFFTD